MSLDKIKDYLGIKRLFVIDIYGRGYMSNVFYIKRIEIYNSKKFIDDQGLGRIAFSKLDIKKITFPRVYALIIEW